jgi:hypothetical protein
MAPWKPASPAGRNAFTSRFLSEAAPSGRLFLLRPPMFNSFRSLRIDSRGDDWDSNDQSFPLGTVLWRSTTINS